ncbi:iron-siderophore ABC transporter substrate-binding protein [Ensifer sp. HO-A22]|uniref:Iron-siderophore ABC transporter substrate-binding protein n=1 Tax=Ensifer oleiphilus TaxID=2742698 RepID=A0A7Y6Q790_9HYPH|nr:iron-siderophore ABC transporter substrate-binding protein [Ensifer oleiphilus]NVD40363.1 iron-siderophore ABC transporter substrate-binding protein [Ensifer oleiphilus]
MVIRQTRRGFLCGALSLLAAPRLHAGEPRRLVTLEWLATEIALLLGEHPVGVADLDGYRRWVSVDNDGLAGAVDVGGRQQPSMEALNRLRPDLILSSTLRHRALEQRLSEVAPTKLLDDEPQDGDLLTAVYTATKAAGEALGRSEAADALLADFDTKLADIATDIAGSKLGGQAVIVAQPLPGVPRLRIFTSNSAVMQIFVRAGFTAALDLPAEPFGFSTIGLEGLAALDGKSKLILLAEEAPAELENSALWPMLPVVVSGGVVPVGLPSWPFGGPASLLGLATNTIAKMQA